MSDILAKAGTQIWNSDRTAGYELTEDAIQNTVIMPHHVKPLGNAPEPHVGEEIPAWFGEVVTRAGGLEAYLERNPQDRV